MKSKALPTFLLAGICLLSWQAEAHFLAFFPQQQVIDKGDSRQLALPIHFTHPATQGPSMSIDKPASVGYILNDALHGLDDSLKPVRLGMADAWQLDAQIRRPGTYTFFANQAPYFDPTEDLVLTQYAKVVVDAFAALGEWQYTLGTPVEILPLTRPFALWTNSLFSGRVLVDGKPAANIPVEMEYYNDTGVTLASDAWASLEVRTNELGEFSVTLPREGWWGIAALVPDTEKFELEGKQYPHEQAGVIWLQVRDME